MSDKNNISLNDVHKLFQSYIEPYKNDSNTSKLLAQLVTELKILENKFEERNTILENKIDQQNQLLDTKINQLSNEALKDDIENSNQKQDLKNLNDKILKLEINNQKNKKKKVAKSAALVGGSVGITKLIEFLQSILT